MWTSLVLRNAYSTHTHSQPNRSTVHSHPEAPVTYLGLIGICSADKGVTIGSSEQLTPPAPAYIRSCGPIYLVAGILSSSRTSQTLSFFLEQQVNTNLSSPIPDPLSQTAKSIQQEARGQKTAGHKDAGGDKPQSSTATTAPRQLDNGRIRPSIAALVADSAPNPTAGAAVAPSATPQTEQPRRRAALSPIDPDGATRPAAREHRATRPEKPPRSGARPRTNSQLSTAAKAPRAPRPPNRAGTERTLRHRFVPLLPDIRRLHRGRPRYAHVGVIREVVLRRDREGDQTTLVAAPLPARGG